jgi:hypothetical protein
MCRCSAREIGSPKNGDGQFALLQDRANNNLHLVSTVEAVNVKLSARLAPPNRATLRPRWTRLPS